MNLPFLRLILAATAALSVAAAPATPKPATTSKPAAKATAKPKTTPKPKATATAKVVMTPVPSPTPDLPAVMDGERKLGTGEASWTLGKDAKHVTGVEGAIQQTGEFKIAILTFPNGKKEKLQIEFMYTGPGPVNQGFLTKVFAVDEDGRYHAWKKGVGDCSVDLAKGTAFEVEGTMSCPKGLLDADDKPAKPILDVKFKAKADSTAAVKTP